MNNMDIHCTHDKMVELGALIPNPANPNKHPDKQIKKLAEIIKHHGIRHPITVSKRSGFIVAGHGRLAAAKELGLTEYPVPCGLSGLYVTGRGIRRHGC